MLISYCALISTDWVFTSEKCSTLVHAIVTVAEAKKLALSAAGQFGSHAGKYIIGRIKGQNVTLSNTKLMEEQASDVSSLSIKRPMRFGPRMLLAFL